MMWIAGPLVGVCAVYLVRITVAEIGWRRRHRKGIQAYYAGKRR